MSVLEAPYAPATGSAPGSSAALGSQEIRIVEAALRCIARWGVSKTTLDDVAREAGYSRATVYRFFPGGKDGLLDITVRAETARFFSSVGEHMAAADTVEDLLVAAIAGASRFINGHGPLQFMLAHEPGVVLPHVAFREMGVILAVVREFGAPYLRPFLHDDVDARRVAEWIARIVLSYTFCPSDFVDMNSDESVRSFVRRFVLPGLATP